MSPGTSEPLVPVGLPYGERQAEVAKMRQAGLPLAPRPGMVPASGTAGRAGSVASPLSPPSGGAPPLNMDLLSELAPSQPWNYVPPDPKADLRRLAQVSPNAFVRAILNRVLSEEQ